MALGSWQLAPIYIMRLNKLCIARTTTSAQHTRKTQASFLNNLYLHCQLPTDDRMARSSSLTNVVVLTTALLLLVVPFVVLSMCAPGTDAARLPQAREEMTTTTALQVQVPVPSDGEAGEDGSVAAASKRLSPGGPDPQHH